MQIGIVKVTITVPNGQYVELDADSSDSVLDLRQMFMDTAVGCAFTCFHFEANVNGVHEEISNYVELGEVVKGQGGLAAAAAAALALGAKKPNAGQNEGDEGLDSEKEIKIPELHLKLVPSKYDERSAKEHVKKIRSVITSPPCPVDPEVWRKDLNNTPQVGDDANEKINVAFISTKNSINDIYQSEEKKSLESKKKPLKKAHAEESAVCLKKLVFSSWNPVPGHRKLFGDLFYLEISTLEGHELIVTASADGFYINNSTVTEFNPTHASVDYHSSSLLELLKKVSPSFLEKFDHLLHRRDAKHPFSLVSPLLKKLNWCSVPEKHEANPNRAESSIVSLYGLEETGQLRSWNDEYQNSLDLPNETGQENLLRTRILNRIYSEFTIAAYKGAQAVVDGNILPLNALEPERTHVWVYNNIFYSQTNDGRDLYKDFGGVETNYKVANHDLEGVKLFNELNLKDLGTLLTCLVTYKGRRIICQGIIPGILHGDQLSSLLYGYMDDGTSVSPNEDFVKILNEAAQSLNIASRSALDLSGNRVLVSSAAETKGILGSDRKMYILDIVRSTPRDANFPDQKKHIACLLRSELLKLYIHTKAVQEVQKAAATFKVANEAAEKGDSKGDAFDEEKVYVEAFKSFSFNVNVLTPFEDQDNEFYAEDKKNIIDVSNFLLSNVIPRFVNDLSNLVTYAIDSYSLTRMLHENGINMRYLGKIAYALKSEEKHVAQIRNLILREVIIRSAKHYFYFLLQLSSSYHNESSLAALISKFLNNFLGVKGFGKNETKESLSAAQRVVKEHRDFQLKLHEDFNLLAQDHVESSTQSVKKKHTLKSKPHISVRFSDGKKAPISLLHPSNIWAAISEHASEKFGFKFDLNSSALFTEFHRTAILREFSQKVGIQVLRKDYNFSVEDTFAESDTLNVYPVVKVNLPIGNEAKQILHSGQVYMSRGNLQMAFSLLSDGLHLLHQIVGPMHEETAQCYASLALICYYAGDFKQGLEYQHRALLISGAVYGIDHSETLHNHVNFALLLHLNQYSASAVSHMKKAYHISELLCGKDHPETVAVLFNLGIILQEMGNVSAAIEAFNSALLGFEACLGLEHLQTAACHHAVAIVNAVASNYRMAIQHEKKAKEIFSKLLGANHRKIEECQTWLKHFTSNAVFFESKTPEKITRPELQENNSKYNWIHTGLLPRVPISSSISIEDLLHHIQNYGGEEGSKLLKNLKSMAKKSEKKSEENDDASAAPALSRSQKKKLRQQKKKAVSSSST